MLLVEVASSQLLSINDLIFSRKYFVTVLLLDLPLLRSLNGPE